MPMTKAREGGTALYSLALPLSAAMSRVATHCPRAVTVQGGVQCRRKAERAVLRKLWQPRTLTKRVEVPVRLVLLHPRVPKVRWSPHPFPRDRMPVEALAHPLQEPASLQLGRTEWLQSV